MIVIKPGSSHIIQVPSRSTDSTVVLGTLLQFSIPASFQTNVIDPVYATVVDTSTNIKTEPITLIDVAYIDKQLSFTLPFESIEGGFYYVYVNSGIELCKFAMFSTDQEDLQNYDIDEGDYIYAPESPQEYKYDR